MKNMAETVSVTVILWIFLLSSGLISAYNGINIQHPIIMVECKCRATENDVIHLMRIDVTLESKSEKLAWIGGDKPGVNHNNFLNVKVFESGKTDLPASLSVLLMGYNPEIGAVFNCSTLATQNGDQIHDSYQIDPQFFDGQNFVKSVYNYCASEDTNPLLIAVIILAVIVLFLAFVTIKFICLDQGRCRAIYSPMLPSYSHHTYSQKEDYNFSQGNNHYSVAWSGRSTTASSKEGGSRMMLGSSKSLSKSNFPYRSHNGSVRSVPPRMPQPPPPPPPPLPRDGPPKKLPAHQSNGSLQSSVTYALPQDAIDEELPTPPQDAIDQELPALPQDITELGLPATGEEDGTDVSSEHYKVPKDSSVNRLSCSL